MADRNITDEFKTRTLSFGGMEAEVAPPQEETPLKPSTPKSSYTSEKGQITKRTLDFNTTGEGGMEAPLNSEEEGFFMDFVSGTANTFKQLGIGFVGITDPEASAQMQKDAYQYNPNIDDIGYKLGSIVGGIIPSGLAIAAMATPIGPAAIYGLSAMYGAAAMGSARTSIYQYEQIHGDVLTDGEEWAVAIGSGLVTAGIEIGSDLLFGSTMAKLGKRTLLSVSDDVGNAFLRGELTGKGLLKYLNKVLPHTVQSAYGGLLEGGEEVLDGVIQQAIKSYYNEDIKFEDWFDNVGSNFAGGVVGGLLLSNTVGRFVGKQATMQDVMFAQHMEKQGYDYDKIRNTVAVNQALTEGSGVWDIKNLLEDPDRLTNFIDMSNRTVEMLRAKGAIKGTLTDTELTTYAEKVKAKIDPDGFYSVNEVKKILTAESFAQFWNTTNNKVIALNKVLALDEKTQAQVELRKLQVASLQKEYNMTEDEAFMTSSLLDVMGLSRSELFTPKTGKIKKGSLLDTKISTTEQDIKQSKIKKDATIIANMRNSKATPTVEKNKDGSVTVFNTFSDTFINALHQKEDVYDRYINYYIRATKKGIKVTTYGDQADVSPIHNTLYPNGDMALAAVKEQLKIEAEAYVEGKIQEIMVEGTSIEQVDIKSAIDSLISYERCVSLSRYP